MRDDALLLVRLVPGMLGRVLLGILLGSSVGITLGGGVALGLFVTGHGGNGWVAFGVAAASTLSFTLGGGAIGALRGSAAALARCVDEMGLVPRLWQSVKPWVLRYAESVRGGLRHGEARLDALRGLSREMKAEREVSGSLAERAERWVSSLLHGALVGGLLAGLLGGDPASWEDVERTGVEQAQEAVGDLLARMFHGPTLLVLLVTVTLAVTPHIVVAFTAL